MTTLAKYMILSGAANRSPLLDKDLTNKDEELSDTEKLQADYDMTAIDIILQGLNHKTNVSRRQHKSNQLKDKIVQLILFIIDSGCTKHMTGNLKLMCNFVEKFLGLNHNLFLVGQFCDANLGVAFKKSTCFVRDLQGNDLLTAQLQDKNIAISELKKLIEKGKGKYVEIKFDKPSVVRQPNAQRIPKP
nr:integrase, catalytic region, zinc finger, CCHC-type, peptidase aspartic, catalytic [Tanacetum cinerariifolium]